MEWSERDSAGLRVKSERDRKEVLNLVWFYRLEFFCRVENS